jgi:hypothetical protein
MSASPQANLVAFLMASLMLSASLARASAARPDARWTVVTTGLVGLACASLTAAHVSLGW